MLTRGATGFAGFFGVGGCVADPHLCPIARDLASIASSGKSALGSSATSSLGRAGRNSSLIGGSLLIRRQPLCEGLRRTPGPPPPGQPHWLRHCPPDQFAGAPAP